jgi:ribose 1,5-bisphosphokinase PhnN
VRISSIKLCWFRGAADSITVDTELKSVAIYGQNGAGKSSFVDAVEYAINNCKIAHLAHEYSGTRQEKAILNTHTPEGRSTEFSIKFKDTSEFAMTIAANGAATQTGAVDMTTWDYRRTVLRQDEMSRFIHSAKGTKYSDLLPLLGLGDLEIAAENLRQLAKTIEQQAKLKEKKGTAAEVARKRKQTFGNASDGGIETKVVELHKKYCPASTVTEMLARCSEVAAALTTRIEKLSTETLKYFALRTIADASLDKAVKDVRDANGKLAGSVEPLIAEKLEVLEAAHGYGTKLTGDGTIPCPACGQVVAKGQFKSHVKAEQGRLEDIIAVFNERRDSVSSLIDVLKLLKSTTGKAELAAWVAKIKAGSLRDDTIWVESFDAEGLRHAASETELLAIEKHWPPLIASAKDACKQAPPEVKELSDDKTLAEAAKNALEAKSATDEIAAVDNLTAFVCATEENIRREIRDKSEAAVTGISGSIEAMWKILHPDEPIDEVRLYLPDDDKAIDIALKFHGKEQNSPRLTLSEGYRNSLGLCIFLALAKREAGSERPLFLDDVVVSFDRNHRGMIVQLLQDEFAGRQVIIFTHDRDWFTELRQQLDDKEWRFRSLLPFETPKIGIRWSNKTTSFDDARAHLKDRPDSAGNDARKIMDVELAIAAEKLQLRLPYLRGDRNDHRMCADFLQRLKSDGKKCFQKKYGSDYPVYAEGLELFEQAEKFLVSWGNKGSHSRDLTRNEATTLIDACEKALGAFKCDSCSKHLWFSEATGAEWVQCQCGDIRWRYGKGGSPDLAAESYSSREGD